MVRDVVWQCHSDSSQDYRFMQQSAHKRAHPSLPGMFYMYDEDGTIIGIILRVWQCDDSCIDALYAAIKVSPLRKVFMPEESKEDLYAPMKIDLQNQHHSLREIWLNIIDDEEPKFIREEAYEIYKSERAHATSVQKKMTAWRREMM